MTISKQVELLLGNMSNKHKSFIKNLVYMGKKAIFRTKTMPSNQHKRFEFSEILCLKGNDTQNIEMHQMIQKSIFHTERNKNIIMIYHIEQNNTIPRIFIRSRPSINHLSIPVLEPSETLPKGSFEFSFNSVNFIAGNPLLPLKLRILKTP